MGAPGPDIETWEPTLPSKSRPQSTIRSYPRLMGRRCISPNAMKNYPVSLFALSALAISCLPAAHAQQTVASSGQPVATLKVQAREVLLPVTVRDKKGALVTNLTAGDFTLTEDGRPQVIKSFTAREQPALPPGPAGGHQPQRLRRHGRASARPRASLST